MGLVALCTEFNRERYFRAREIAMGVNTRLPSFCRKFALIYVLRVNRRYAADIYTRSFGGAVFDGLPTLPHDLSGIFIAGTAHIGKRCTILQQVTIGNSLPAYDGSFKAERGPTIGDDVVIGAGAKLLGPIHIGNDVRIGANAVVLQDVPDHCTAVGVPARIIQPENSRFHKQTMAASPAARKE